MSKNKIIRSFSCLQDLVNLYIEYGQEGMNRELTIMSLALSSNQFSATEKAEIYLMGGHQWYLNLYPSEKDLIIKALAEEQFWTLHPSKFGNNFEKLHKYISERILKHHQCKRVGALTLYDLCKRLSGILHILPEDYIYQHAGSHEGIKKLLSVERFTTKPVLIKTVPKCLQPLGALYVEDFLCVMKDALACPNLVGEKVFVIDNTPRCHIPHINEELKLKLLDFQSKNLSQNAYVITCGNK